MQILWINSVKTCAEGADPWKWSVQCDLCSYLICPTCAWFLTLAEMHGVVRTFIVRRSVFIVKGSIFIYVRTVFIVCRPHKWGGKFPRCQQSNNPLGCRVGTSWEGGINSIGWTARRPVQSPYLSFRRSWGVLWRSTKQSWTSQTTRRDGLVLAVTIYNDNTTPPGGLRVQQRGLQ